MVVNSISKGGGGKSHNLLLVTYSLIQSQEVSQILESDEEMTH